MCSGGVLVNVAKVEFCCCKLHRRMHLAMIFRDVFFDVATDKV
jgi:hypothetical protein